MDIKEKQAIWLKEKPLFEAELIHSHLLPFFTFNENTGDYEIKSECVNNTDDEDCKLAYESLNTGWAMWLRAKRDAKAQAVPEGFVLVPQEPTELFKEHLKNHLFDLWAGDHGCDWDGFVSVDAINHNTIWKMMIEAQEQSHE